MAAIGFRAGTDSGARFVVREGQWAPIQVRLSAQGTMPFQGQLCFEAADLDGDRVSYRATPITVSYDAEPKRVWCYAVCLAEQGMVSILDDQGLLINRLPVPAFDLIGDDTMLILDISEPPLTKLRTLKTPGWSPKAYCWGSRPYYRNVLVAEMPAADLPDRWFGLEAVNVVVWDSPNPDQLSIAQLQALKHWVRHGGQLVVGLGQSWAAVQKSELAELLPLNPASTQGAADPSRSGVSLTVNGMEQFFEKLVLPSQSRPAHERTFSHPIAIAAAETRPGALRSFRTLVSGGSAIDLITTDWFGSGRVVAVAANLRDLMTVPVNEAFYTQLFDLNPTTKEFRENELNSLQMQLGIEATTLYDGLLDPISFAGWSGLLVLAAFAFVVVYIGLATLLSWRWLKKHTLTTYSWTLFAVIAIIASAFSLGTVGLMHGLARGVKTLNLVDLEAGSSAARARCYFGYSSPIRQVVDLSLPGEQNYLRGLARGPELPSHYATPQRYSALARAALLEDTPMRATLKQFEGFWQGELSGSVRAQLVADRRTGEITPESWIQNDLDVDLVGGYLLYIDPRFREDDLRLAGQTINWWGHQDVPPALNVLALWVPPLKAGEKVNGLGLEDYAEIKGLQTRWIQRLGQKPESRPDLYTLWDEQQAWVFGGKFRAPWRGLDSTACAALLTTTRNFYLHCKEDKGTYQEVNGRPISTEGLMELDVTHWLMQGRVKAGQGEDPLLGQAVLLLLANDPGPARLHRNGQPLKSIAGRSLYRVRVPLAFQGRPPVPSEVFQP